MKKIRVAYIGDSPFLHTGFGNVAKGIMSRWDMDRFEVHVLGTMHHYIPRDTAPYETYEPVPHNDPMGFRASVTFIQRVNPDVLFLIGDPGTLRNRFEGIKFAGMGKLMPTVTYFPIEGIPLNPHIIEQARFVFGPVTYTNWGADLLREKGIEVGVAPHGVDHADFRQYSREDKERLKAIVGWEGKTVIGTVGVNKRTNRQPSLIETARVIKDSGVENFVMYLHCQMRGEGFMGGWELDWMPKEFGVEDHIAFKPGQNEDRYFGRPNKAEVDVFSLPLPADKKEAEANLEKLGYIDILNLFDIYIDPAGAHGWNLPACFIPGTPVETVNGMVSIETVKPGDSVLSHDGFFHSVVSVSETPYSGYATSIKTMGIGEVTCTPEHPFLCVKRSGNDRRGRLGAMKSDAEWVIASEIEVGDYLCVPKSSIRSEMPGRFDLADFCLGAVVDGEEIYYKSGYSPSSFGYGQIAEKFGISRDAVRQILGIGRGQSYAERDDVLAWAEENYETPAPIRYSRFLPCEPDLFRLLGYYAAEGCCGGGFVDFAFHADEEEYHADVSRLVVKYFGKVPSVKHIGNGLHLKFPGKPMVEFFSATVGCDAHNKRVPLIDSLDIECAKEFVVGAWRGDGSMTKNGFRYSTVSESLVYGMAKILMRLGFFASISRADREGRGIEYTLSVTGRQALGFEKILGFGYVNDGRTGQAFWEDDDFVYIPVRSVEMVPYSGFVYNMEVEGSHSYTANRLAVHNCEAARCGVPIIMVDDGFARHEIFSDVVHMLAPTASEYWHTGAVLPLVSPKKMADAIMKMIDSEDMRRVYGAAGKAKFDKYKWQPTADYFAEKVVAADKFGAEMMAKLANREVGKDVQDVEG